MASCDGAFIECTSLSFNYAISGVCTVSYTMVHNTPNFCYVTTLEAGGQIFSGYISDMTMKTITGTSNWYETNVVLITVTNN